MSAIDWERRHKAFKAIHDKLDEILAKLDLPGDPQIVEVLKGIINRGTDIAHGQKTVGTTAVQLTSTSTPCISVTVKADDDNSGNIYVGKSGVTTTTGFRLKAGQGQTLNIDNVNKVYAIGSAASQKAHWIAEVA